MKRSANTFIFGGILILLRRIMFGFTAGMLKVKLAKEQKKSVNKI